jgi:hypothetical protein
MASNEAQMKSRFQKPIKVTGPVFEVKNKYGEWHVRLMTHEIARGVDGWIECVMTSDKGLSSLSQGASATVEGTYDKGTGSVVHLRKCKLICP